MIEDAQVSRGSSGKPESSDLRLFLVISMCYVVEN